MKHQSLNKGWQITAALTRFKNIFHSKFLERLAVFTGFVRRHGLLNGEEFVGSCLNMCLEEGWNGSLSEHCMVLKEQYGISIRPQSLDERFNQHSEQMMRYVFEQVLQVHLRQSDPMHLLDCFEEVYIEDSTNFVLPLTLKTRYKGSGGDASPAGLKIDHLYGLRWGSIGVLFHDSAGSDTWQGVPPMQAGSLLLRDLGYFNLGDFEQVAANGSYFLSRLRFGTLIYENAEASKQVDLLSLVDKMKENQIHEMTAWVGEKKCLKVRLVLQKVPPAVFEHKRNKIKKERQHKGKKVSENRLAFCAANCYLTNIDADLMTSAEVIHLYGLRWIIEILFKAWKSISNLGEKMKSMKPNRFMCLLYAHMIKTLVDSKTVYFFKIEFWNLFGFKISELKAFTVLKTFRHRLWAAIQTGTLEDLKSVFDKIAETIFELAEKRQYGKTETHMNFYTFVKIQT